MRDILIVIIMGVLYLAAFYKAPEKYTPIASQKIYDLFASEDTSTEQAQESLAIIDINKTKLEQKQTTADKVANVINEQKNRKLKETKKQIKEMVETISKEKQGAALEINYQFLHNVVTESKKSFFFELQQELNGVKVSLVSYTPYENKGVLKIKIENNSSSYFFYSSFSLRGLKSQLYGSQFVKTGGTSDLYLVFEPTINKSLTLDVIEQQSKRIFKINFNIP